MSNTINEKIRDNHPALYCTMIGLERVAGLPNTPGVATYYEVYLHTMNAPSIALYKLPKYVKWIKGEWKAFYAHAPEGEFNPDFKDLETYAWFSMWLVCRHYNLPFSWSIAWMRSRYLTVSALVFPTHTKAEFSRSGLYLGLSEGELNSHKGILGPRFGPLKDATVGGDVITITYLNEEAAKAQGMPLTYSVNREFAGVEYNKAEIFRHVVKSLYATVVVDDETIGVIQVVEDVSTTTKNLYKCIEERFGDIYPDLDDSLVISPTLDEIASRTYTFEFNPDLAEPEPMIVSITRIEIYNQEEEK